MPTFNPQIDSINWVTIQHARDNLIKFPHHGQAEYNIFKRYLQQINDNGYVAFDVRLPNSYSQLLQTNENSIEFKMGTLLEWRVDGIIQFRNDWRIIEIKRRISKSGVGQVLLYRENFKDNFDYRGSVHCYVVAEQDDIDVKKYASKLGVECRIV